MTLYLSPEASPAGALLALIAGAQTSLHVSAYALTWPAFVAALIAAHARGVAVAVLVDSSQTLNPAQHALVKQLQLAGVPTLVGTSPRGGLLHGKYLVADGLITAHGSFNWSLSAPTQDNTCEIVADGARAAAFLAHWQRAHDWISAHPRALPTMLEEEIL